MLYHSQDAVTFLPIGDASNRIAMAETVDPQLLYSVVRKLPCLQLNSFSGKEDADHWNPAMVWRKRNLGSVCGLLSGLVRSRIGRDYICLRIRWEDFQYSTVLFMGYASRDLDRYT